MLSFFGSISVPILGMAMAMLCRGKWQARAISCNLERFFKKRDKFSEPTLERAILRLEQLKTVPWIAFWLELEYVPSIWTGHSSSSSPAGGAPHPRPGFSILANHFFCLLDLLPLCQPLYRTYLSWFLQALFLFTFFP